MMLDHPASKYVRKIPAVHARSHILLLLFWCIFRVMLGVTELPCDNM